MDMLQGKTILNKQMELVSADVAFKKKSLILFYFTASDCDACRAFDPKLKEVYNEANHRMFELAILVISADTDKESFLANIRTNYSDWYAVRFEDDLSQVLTLNYGVTHMPSLIVCRKNGTVVTREGRSDVERIGINVLVTWSE